MGLAYFHLGTTTKPLLIVLYFEERPRSKKPQTRKSATTPTTTKNAVKVLGEGMHMTYIKYAIFTLFD